MNNNRQVMSTDISQWNWTETTSTINPLIVFWGNQYVDTKQTIEIVKIMNLAYHAYQQHSGFHIRV